jgi:hypothetical protein
VRGERPTHFPARTTHRWLCLRLDYRAYRHLASRGELSAARWLLSLLASPKIYDLFAWTDPLPFVRALPASVGARLRRLAVVRSA